MTKIKMPTSFRRRATGFLAVTVLAATFLVAYGLIFGKAFFQVDAATLSFTGVWGTLPQDSGGHGIMFGDVDSDGNPDMYVTLNKNQGVAPELFFSNKGGWVFKEESVARGIDDSNDGGSHGAAWADLDNDGDYDLLNGATLPPGFGVDETSLGENNDLYRNDGDGQFTQATPTAFLNNKNRTRAILALDWDNDGDLDVFSVEGSDTVTPPEAYQNDGDFQFTEITSGALVNSIGHQGATDTDYDGDGDVDILMGNRHGKFGILKNDGSGNFTVVVPSSIGLPDAANTAGDGITTGDIDNDGDLDILLSSDNKGNLYLNSGEGTFTFKQSFTNTDGYMGGFADLDNDGDLDLVFSGDKIVHLNNGTGIFNDGPAVPVSGLSDPRGMGFADIDNDGDMDFAFGYKSSRSNFIRNNFDSGNWLKVALISPIGQAGAFGAKTRIYPAGQGESGPILGLRESKSNYGYLGQDDPVIHFGLGSHTAVDVVVTFLDGTQIARVNVAANQKILINGEIVDSTPPTRPTDVTAIGTSESQIELSWTAAVDPESAVSFYTIYRDGSEVATTAQTQISDVGLAEATTHTYRVSATNTAGLEGTRSVPVSGTTLADTTPPALSNLSILNETTVSVRFTEPVEQASAETPGNYSIDKGIDVTSVVLSADLQTVILTTAAHAPDTTYILTVINVQDRANTPNTILPDSQGSYVLVEVDPALISYWTFDEGSGPDLKDTVGTNQGTLENMDLTTSWVPGQQGTALQFDGIDDSVSILNFDPPHAGTITFWLNPDTVPSLGRQRIMGGHDAYEITLERGQIRSQLFAGGSSAVESTTLLSPNQWYHIAATYDFTTTQNLEIYLDGVLEAANSLADDDPEGPFTFSLGTRTGRSEFYHGILDNVRIYDRVLTEAEVVQVMQDEDPITDPVSDLQVEWSISMYQDPADGATGLKVDISRAVKRSTGEDAEVSLGGFQSQLTYDGSCVNILDIRPLGFPDISENINNSVGMATFKDLEAAGVPLPVDLGHALTSLVASASEQCSVEVSITDLVDQENNPIEVVPATRTQNLRRGDARADREINIADALYIAQHLAGLRPACTTPVEVACIHAVNAAGAENDIDLDRITISDSQFIAEFLVGLRSNEYSLNP